MNAARALPGRESDLAARWGAGLGGPLRLEDGRVLRVVFPGIPGGGSGPDYCGAILEADGDLLRGDVEVHLLASGWRAHGHDGDPAYQGVILHVVGANDSPGALTGHRSGRMIPILVLPPVQAGFPVAFTPPCALEVAKGRQVAPVLERLGMRRLRIKAARIAPAVAAGGSAQALYAGLLETLGGTANREAFGRLAVEVPLALLLELMEEAADRSLAASAQLKAAGGRCGLRRSGFRPLASPERRVEAAGRLVSRLWPRHASVGWPATLGPGAAPASLSGEGISTRLAIECMVNAVLPVALAAKTWPENEVERTYLQMHAPGEYGRLKQLERWLGSTGVPVFPTAAQLQGGLLLHTDYCTRGRCGRCPLSE